MNTSHASSGSVVVLDASGGIWEGVPATPAIRIDVALLTARPRSPICKSKGKCCTTKSDHKHLGNVCDDCGGLSLLNVYKNC